ncbi:MAG: double-strand break repair protein AddB [Alphaproteobacteria bacterium]
MNVYNIAARFKFSETLVDNIFEEANGDLFKISQYVILLPSRRACRNLRSAFLKKTSGKPMLLPSMYPLGEVDEEELNIDNLAAGNHFEINSSISSLEQRILLTKLIKKYSPKKNLAESISLAIELASFLADLQKEQIDLKNLHTVFPEDLAEHWQNIMSFLQIISIEWPKILEERKLLDPIIRRNKIIEYRAKSWAKNPPEYRIIAAGSTGSMPSTAQLLKVIANLPKGMVVLPALDNFIDDISWENIDEFHPQNTLKNLLNFFEIDRKQVKELTPTNYKENVNYSRSLFMSEIMRPANTSNKWINIKQLEIGTLKGVSWINCENMQQEASVISLILREVLETKDKTAALVTTDKELAKRVAILIRKWNIEIDYSEGEKLSHTPLGVYMRLIIEMAKSNFASVQLLAILKHPLTNLGFNRSEFRKFIAELEIVTLRGIRVQVGLNNIKETIKIYNHDYLITIIDRLEEYSSKFVSLFKEKSISFDEIFEAHIELAEKMAFNEQSTGLWNSISGEQLNEFFTELRVYGKSLGRINPFEYNQIFDNLMIGQTFRKPYGMHPRLAILTPIEARMHNFDMLVLGALNEGVWPKYPESGPWISRKMRKEIGLSMPEKKIGQSAHDFFSLSQASEVIFTRSLKVEGTLTVASRWLQRLETVLKGVGIKANSFNVKPWDKWIEMLNTPKEIVSITSPAPKPDICFRPTQFSVTQIEKLIRDPYSIYASQILKLKNFNDIDSEPKAADFGNFIHKALELFVSYKNTDNESEYEILMKCGIKALDDLFDKPLIKNIWWPRFERISYWFLQSSNPSNKHKIYSEVSGKCEFKIDNASYILTTKADRIEIDEFNNFHIIDYKTGNLPDRSSILKGVSSQMILEALIGKKGGYLCQAKNHKYNIGELIYLRLTGSETAGEIKKIEEDIEYLTEQANTGIEKLFKIFNNKDTAYLYCPNPSLTPKYNEYEHLARVKEWIE